MLSPKASRKGRLQRSTNSDSLQFQDLLLVMLAPRSHQDGTQLHPSYLTGLFAHFREVPRAFRWPCKVPSSNIYSFPERKSTAAFTGKKTGVSI